MKNIHLFPDVFVLVVLVLIHLLHRPGANRPSSQMAAENVKNVYRHWKEHLYFSNPAKFQHFRCNIS